MRDTGCRDTGRRNQEILERFDSKLLFEGSTQQDITSGLRRLLADSSQLPSRSALANTSSTTDTWDVVVLQIADVFRLAIQGFAGRNMNGNVESQETEFAKILNGSGANARWNTRREKSVYGK